jgi:hypothetical protein
MPRAACLEADATNVMRGEVLAVGNVFGCVVDYGTFVCFGTFGNQTHSFAISLNFDTLAVRTSFVFDVS